MADHQTLKEAVEHQFVDQLQQILSLDCLTLELTREHLVAVCQTLRDHPEFYFDMLIDVCGVDYLHYGLSEWRTQSTTATGFSRGVIREASQMQRVNAWDKPRFAVVYHLLSLKKQLVAGGL